MRALQDKMVPALHSLFAQFLFWSLAFLIPNNLAGLLFSGPTQNAWLLSTPQFLRHFLRSFLKMRASAKFSENSFLEMQGKIHPPSIFREITPLKDRRRVQTKSLTKRAQKFKVEKSTMYGSAPWHEHSNDHRRFSRK